jgi:transcriptional regulator with XRE-family HTH domain
MHETEHATSKLREVRERVGISARELARTADIGLSTLLGAEHGRQLTPANRERVERALADALRERHDDTIASERAAVARAESELEAAQTRLERARTRLGDVQQQHERNVAALDVGLWDELDDASTVGKVARVAA